MKKDGDRGQQQQQGEEEVRVLHPLSYMSGNLKKKMEEVLGCRFSISPLTNFDLPKSKANILGPNPRSR